jgi:hypothetical protein
MEPIDQVIAARLVWTVSGTPPSRAMASTSDCWIIRRRPSASSFDGARVLSRQCIVMKSGATARSASPRTETTTCSVTRSP